MHQTRGLQMIVIGCFTAVLLLVAAAELLPGEEGVQFQRDVLFYVVLVAANIINLVLLSLLLSGRMTDLTALSAPMIVLYTLLIGTLVQQSGGAVSSFHILFVVPILVAAVYHHVRGAAYSAILVCAVWSAALLVHRPEDIAFSVVRTHLLVGNGVWIVVALIAGYLARAQHEMYEKNVELVKAGINLTSIHDLRELLHFIVEMAASVVKAEAGALLLRDEATGELRFQVALGDKAEAVSDVLIKPGQGVVGWVVQHGEPVLIRDARQDRRFFSGVDEETGFATHSILCVPLRKGDRVLGALELLNKQDGEEFDHSDLENCEALGSQAAVAIENAQLMQDKDEAFLATVDAMATALEFRDTDTEGHSRRVREYTLLIAEEMGVSKAEMIPIGNGAVLHDIGKIAVPDAILRKPGKLTDEEYEEMKKHSQHGQHILRRIQFLTDAAVIPLHHHERWDGTGYPGGLAGEAIPVGCRAFAVADTLDAITSDRPYRRAQSLAVAREEIRKFVGTQFDPKAVEAFERIPDSSFLDVRQRIMAGRPG